MTREDSVDRRGAIVAMIFMRFDPIRRRMMRTNGVYRIADGNMPVGYVGVMCDGVEYRLVFRVEPRTGGAIRREIGSILSAARLHVRIWRSHTHSRFHFETRFES